MIVMASLALLSAATHANATPVDCSTLVGNLVSNCSFEGGTVSGQPVGWTFTPAANGSSAFVVGSLPLTGANSYGFFGSGADEISQSISTVAGHNYAVTFGVHPRGNPETSFSADFGANTLLTLTDPPAVPDPANNDYVLYSFDQLATSPSTVLAFFGMSV
jgi:hypothetical protein